MFSNDYDRALSDIFARRAERRIESAEEERALIAKVAAGDDIDGSATIALLYAYAPEMRRGFSWYKNAAFARREVPSDYDIEEVRSRAVEGVLKAIHTFDPEKYDRLAATVSGYVLDSVVAYAADSLEFTVSPRTLKRYFQVMRAADNETLPALASCGVPGPGKDLSKSTFLAIHTALRDVESYSAETRDGETEWADRPVSSLWQEDAIDDVEARVMVELVFDRLGDADDLTEREAEVLLYRYGFKPLSEDHGDRAVSDAMVAREIGSTRPTVARDHGKALGKARARLGA